MFASSNCVTTGVLSSSLYSCGLSLNNNLDGAYFCSVHLMVNTGHASLYFSKSIEHNSSREIQ